MRVLYEWPRCDAQLSKSILQLYEDDCRIHFPHAFKVRAMLFYSLSTEHLSRQKIEDLPAPHCATGVMSVTQSSACILASVAPKSNAAAFAIHSVFSSNKTDPSV